MLRSSKDQLVRRPVRIRNPHDYTVVIWLEPWAERFELAPQQFIDIVLVGADTGWYELVTGKSEVAVYGWEGTVAFAFQNGRLARRQPTIDEIVRQELEIAKDRVALTNAALPTDNIVEVQLGLDSLPELNDESQEMACKLAGSLIDSLALCLHRSSDSANLLWQIADRLVATKGLVLAAVDPVKIEAAIWGRRGKHKVIDLVAMNSLSVVPEDCIPDKTEDRVAHAATRRTGI